MSDTKKRKSDTDTDDQTPEDKRRTLDDIEYKRRLLERMNPANYLDLSRKNDISLYLKKIFDDPALFPQDGSVGNELKEDLHQCFARVIKEMHLCMKHLDTTGEFIYVSDHRAWQELAEIFRPTRYYPHTDDVSVVLSELERLSTTIHEFWDGKVLSIDESRMKAHFDARIDGTGLVVWSRILEDRGLCGKHGKADAGQKDSLLRALAYCMSMADGSLANLNDRARKHLDDARKELGTQ